MKNVKVMMTLIFRPKKKRKGEKINPIHLQSTTKEISEELSISVLFFSLILESSGNRYVHCYELSV